ncbi:MAG: hypothetical protein CSA36_03465 [Draconibacterium sp.]|nr:MAG: hypothetical protein CSA36_03465 [Draconibacterium sp.]
MKTIALFLLLLAEAFLIGAQEVSYDASWISAQGIELNAHNVIHFRKTLDLSKVPEKFRVKISADNKYRLFVNGNYVCTGPGRSDLEHWYYQTVDLAAYLQPGKNVFAVEVINFGPRRGAGQQSHLTALFVEGETNAESVINTGNNGWKASKNNAFFERIVRWQDRIDITQGLYVANPTDSIVGKNYLWGWQTTDFDDSSWKPAKYLDISAFRYNNASGIFYPQGWLLYERPIKNQIEKKEQLATFYKLPGLITLATIKNHIVPANSKLVILIDNNVMTLGYPELWVNGGNGSHIKATYAETLFHNDRIGKDDRNKIEGNQIIGISDIFMPDGGQNRIFRPNWFRSFRFIQLEISTKDEPLEIIDYYNMKSAYPLEMNAQAETDNPFWDWLMETGWRTASLCAQDFLLSDAYYEQMQYIGDARIHGEAITYLSGNDDLVRQVIMQGNWSRVPEGLTHACYPDGFNLVIPIYSLAWIDIIYDHMMWAGDKDFTTQFHPGIYSVLEWFNSRLQPNGLMGPIDWWAYADWCVDWQSGVPPGGKTGNSALFSLHYAYTLQNAAKIYRFTGEDHLADICDQRAYAVVDAVNKLCFDKEKGIYSDTPEMKFYSMHTNIFAVLAGATKDKEARNILSRILDNKTLSQVGLYFHHYLFEAFNLAGMDEAFFQQLEGWKEMRENHLTTFTEVALTGTRSQRSDCHPWSCSPNIHFFRTVCGIHPVEEGFKKVTISPHPGDLKHIVSKLSHPNGEISLNLRFKDKSVKGEIFIPEKMETVFKWKGRIQLLKAGKNSINM